MAPEVYTEAEITECLIALISWGGQATATVRALKAQGKRTPTPVTLTAWSRDKYAARFNELSEKYAEQLEGQLIAEYRSLIRRALDVERLALDRTEARLKANEDNDPGRTAANLSRVSQSHTDKMLSLSGRPTAIKEDRGPEAVIAALVAMKVLKPLDDSNITEASQIEAGDEDAGRRNNIA